MIDIVELAERSGAEVRDIRRRIDAAVRQYEDKVDMGLMGEVIEDMMAARLTTGDIAAIYAYRLGKKRHG